jgi:hypothetical protein
MCCAAHTRKMSKAERAAYRAGIQEVRRLARQKLEDRLTEEANANPSPALRLWMASLRARALSYGNAYPLPILPALPAEWIGQDTLPGLVIEEPSKTTATATTTVTTATTKDLVLV